MHMNKLINDESEKGQERPVIKWLQYVIYRQTWVQFRNKLGRVTTHWCLCITDLTNTVPHLYLNFHEWKTCSSTKPSWSKDSSGYAETLN